MDILNPPTYQWPMLSTLYGSGATSRTEAWKVKRLVSVFSRQAKRGHYPREVAMRRIFMEAGIDLPDVPRYSVMI